MRFFYFKNDNIFVFDGNTLSKTDGTVIAVGTDDVNKYIKDNQLDCMPCGMHPNACPCGDGACPDYIP